MSQPYKKNKGRGQQGGKQYTTPCKFFLRGNCSNQRCPYLHVRDNQNKQRGGRRGEKNAFAEEARVVATMFKLFLEKQKHVIYNAEQGRLDLSHLARYEDFKAVTSSVNLNTRTFSEVLCNCVRDVFVPPPSILQLDDNGILSFFNLSTTLKQTCLHTPLRALSLAGNQINSTEIAQDLKEFVNLIEVNLIGNPVVDQPDYKEKFKKYLPGLMGLDGKGLVAPPLLLPWPRFMDPSAVKEREGDLAYDAAQRNVLQFIQSTLLNPLEAEPAPGVTTGVDAVSDVYSLHATLTLCMSSNDAAVNSPARTAGGSSVATQRDVIREIVGFRLRQTESNHNVLLGVKSTQVAVGRTRVCAQLEHWLYPRSFIVGHYIHSSPDVAILDNNGFGPNAVVGMKQPLSVVTLHGVMIWRYRTVGSNSDTAAAALLRDAVVIKRNFSRVLTVTTTEAGRWQIVNDMVSLYPFTGTEVAAPPDARELTMENVLYKDIHPYDVVFSPASDPNRAGRLARKYRVPEPVVATLCQYAQNDAELLTILADLGDIPLSTFEQCAQLVEMEPMASVLVCRLAKCYGVDPNMGAQLVKQFGLNWAAMVAEVSGGNSA